MHCDLQCVESEQMLWLSLRMLVTNRDIRLCILKEPIILSRILSSLVHTLQPLALGRELSASVAALVGWLGVLGNTQ
jgi:hypothetical protein